MFYTAPTLLRSLMQFGDKWVTAHDRSSLRILGTVGEPINPHAWNWFNEVRVAGCEQQTGSGLQWSCNSWHQTHAMCKYCIPQVSEL